MIAETKEIIDKIAQYQELEEEKAKISNEIDKIKTFFERLSEQELTDSKLKTSEYHSGDAFVNVSNSGTIKIISGQLIKKMLGDAFDDFAEIEQTVKLKNNAKPILSAIFLGEYIDRSPDNVITEMTADNSKQCLLHKKLKGNYKKDIERIQNILGVSERDADYYAYMFAEATIWERFNQFMNAAGTPINEALELLKSAIIVDESLKVSLKAV